MPGPLYLLGPQRPSQNLSLALEALPGSGPVVTITAGWRHDEGEHGALHEVIGADAVNLPLYEWFEEIMNNEPALREAYKRRQTRLLDLKELYRLRLHAALVGVRELLALHAQDPELVGPQLEEALRQLREIEASYLRQSEAIFDKHPDVQRPWLHPAVGERRAQAAELISKAKAIAIAGGHVAVLRNRMMLFGVHQQLIQAWVQGTAVVAWSAGAMVLTERVVLFYDDPPDGPSQPELLDTGFGLVPNLVVLPHARRRLRLGDRKRVSLLGHRLSPARCIGMENGAWLEVVDGQLVSRGLPGTALHLQPDGDVVPLESR